MEGGARLTGAGAAMTTLAECTAILFDFGGTLDSDGGHWLDRFYALYADAGPRLPAEEVKRAFYRADAACEQDPEVNRMGLRALMRLHVRLQFEGLGVRDPERERQMVERFCEPMEAVLRRNAAVLRRLRRARRLGVVSNFYGNVDVLCRRGGPGRVAGCDRRLRAGRDPQARSRDLSTRIGPAGGGGCGGRLRGGLL